MYQGEGVEEHEIPPVLFEVEVETENVETEIERGQVKTKKARTTTSSSIGPLFPKRFPFRTASGFGRWILSKLGSSPTKYVLIHMRFAIYCSTFKIKELVRFGKRIFHGFDRLCFLHGVFLVAVTAPQKVYVYSVFTKESMKISQGTPLKEEED